MSRLSQSARLVSYGNAQDDEPSGKDLKEEKEPQRQKNLVGSVKEKGFSTDWSFPLAHRISVPEPRVTSFPVARYRSDGPHWGLSPSKQCSSHAAADTVTEFPMDEDGVQWSAADVALPLSRRKPAESLTSSNWRSGRKSKLNISSQVQNVFDNTRQLSRTAKERDHQGARQISEVPRALAERRDSNPKLDRIGQSISGASLELGFDEEASNDLQGDYAIVALQTGPAQDKLWKSSGKQIQSVVQMPATPMEVEERSEFGGGDSKPAQTFTDDGDIDAENRKALFAMSAEEVAEAQAELREKLQPGLLSFLRKRGAGKERKILAQKSGDSIAVRDSERIDDVLRALPSDEKGFTKPVSTSSQAQDSRSVTSIQRGLLGIKVSDDQTALRQAETKRRTRGVGSLESFAQEGIQSNGLAEESSTLPPTTDSWTLRVEAVRSIKFDLDGNVISVGRSAESNEAVECNPAASALPSSPQHITIVVVERDYLRTEGDPAGTGYSLKETLALVRSTVAGQRAVALHLIASVLDKAIRGLQDLKFNLSSALHGGEEVGEGQPDWQAIWAYILGPEAELVLTLRLALDDAHSTVVAACARALQALLSYSANESYFDALEALWPGDKFMYTAPVFRRKTKHDEGFIGGGQWKYNVKTREMFPFSESESQKSEKDGEEATVASDSHISNKDVAAGLIRMGVLPRIRYLLEVDQLLGVEEALLSVLICLARHSPTAANAVMTCPRLIDAIVQRFIATECLSEESWSARFKAIRLLKVLAQAEKANCVHFESIGALTMVMRPLLQQARIHTLSEPAKGQGQGHCEVMIETIRFWRVCISYGVSILLFADCYPTLSFWLLPLSKEEILNASKDELLSLTLDSYMLLEHMARTLPLLHNSDEPIKQAGEDVNWSWSVAVVMLDTAMKWISPEYVSGVQVVLEQFAMGCEQQSHGTMKVENVTKKVLGVVTAVLHFLATICERILSEKHLHRAMEDPENYALPWLPTFLPQLGVVLAQSGLLHFSQSNVQADLPVSTMDIDEATPVTTLTFVQCLRFCKTQADSDTALVAISCLNGIVRVNNIVDSLIYAAKPSATPPVENQTLAHGVLECGLLLSAETELRNLLVLCKENVLLRNDLLQMGLRGGPAPGVGIGWGSFCGGVWSKEVIIAQASAGLALDLMSLFSSRVWLSNSEKKGDTSIEESDQSQQQVMQDVISKVKFCLSVVSTSAIANREQVHRACSTLIFHPSTLSIFTQIIEEVLVCWRDYEAQEDGFQVESYGGEGKNLNPEDLSKTLLKHLETFWLAVKKKSKSKEEVEYRGASNRNSKDWQPDLAPVEEGLGKDDISPPESLMVEWVGQRLPLPSHWFLSPMVVDANSLNREKVQPEEVIIAGLTFFLGIEVLSAKLPDDELIHSVVPLVRKIHSLSTVFISGGEVFLDPTAHDLIGALQSLVGDQMKRPSTNSPEGSTRGREAGEEAMTPGSMTGSDLIECVRNLVLDFEGSIDASYLTYAQMLAEQFVATSFGDRIFGRQVAFYLCLEVPVMIRLVTWRVLGDGRVLDLLPPLSQCAGPPQNYLYPVEGNQDLIDYFLSAWSSGALDRASKLNSLSFTLQLHHLVGHLFDTSDTEETLLLKMKTARALVRSSIGKLDHQEMISRLVRYVPACPPSNCELVTEDGKNLTHKIKLRLSLLYKACEGDSLLAPQVQRLQKLVVSRV